MAILMAIMAMLMAIMAIRMAIMAIIMAINNGHNGNDKWPEWQ